MAARPFDVIVYGSTGFTGKLVARALCQNYQGKVKWALAGRDSAKMEEVRRELVKINADCKDVPILVADCNNASELGAMLSKAKVVLSTTGPYSIYGTKVVEQSIESGTHYCDITGEVPWVKSMLVKYNSRAQEKGVKIVHCCGFDSVPSDLGTLMMVDHLKTKLNKKTAKVTILLEAGQGGVSGGTIASAMAIAKSTPGSELVKVSSDAYYLAEGVGGKGTAKPSPMAATFIPEADKWAGPFVMEGVNARIVQLSAALLKYGSDFKYTEMVATGKGWSGWAGANGSLAALGAMALMISNAPGRFLAGKFLPKPGQGPTEQAMANGHWRMACYATTEEEPGVAPTLVKGRIGDKRDPGYTSTARMLLECGLALALDSDKLDKAGCVKSGVMTPAAAVGLPFIDRLRKAGFTWEVLPSST